MELTRELKLCSLISFDREQIKALVDYVLIDAPSQEDRKVAFKFPNIAADLLSNRNKIFVNFFIKKSENSEIGVCPSNDFYRLTELVSKFGEPVHNLTRASYISKILCSLIFSKPNIFLPIMLESIEFISGLLINLESKSLSSLMELILTAEGPLSSPLGALSTFENEELKKVRLATIGKRLLTFQKLLNFPLENIPSNEIESRIGACELIVDLFSKKYENQKLFCEVFQNSFFEKYLQNILDAEYLHNDSFVLVLIGYIQNWISSPNTLEVPENHLKRFLAMSLILIFGRENCQGFPKDSEKVHGLKTKEKRKTNGLLTSMPKVSLTLVKIIEVLSCLITAIIERNLYWDELPELIFFAERHAFLFTSHPYCNLLHRHVTKLLISVIKSENANLFDLFFVKNENFLGLISFIGNSPIHFLSNGKNLSRTGCLGHLKQFCLEITRSKFSELMYNIPEWRIFVDNFLSKENYFEVFSLGGMSIQPSGEAENPKIFLSLEEVQEAFTEFLAYSEPIKPEIKTKAIYLCSCESPVDSLPLVSESDAWIQELENIKVSEAEKKENDTNIDSRAEIIPEDCDEDEENQSGGVEDDFLRMVEGKF